VTSVYLLVDGCNADNPIFGASTNIKKLQDSAAHMRMIDGNPMDIVLASTYVTYGGGAAGNVRPLNPPSDLSGRDHPRMVSRFRGLLGGNHYDCVFVDNPDRDMTCPTYTGEFYVVDGGRGENRKVLITTTYDHAEWYTRKVCHRWHTTIMKYDQNNLSGALQG
jgi:hypothetical protein